MYAWAGYLAVCLLLLFKQFNSILFYKFLYIPHCSILSPTGYTNNAFGSHFICAHYIYSFAPLPFMRPAELKHILVCVSLYTYNKCIIYMCLYISLKFNLKTQKGVRNFALIIYVVILHTLTNWCLIKRVHINWLLKRYQYM